MRVAVVGLGYWGPKHVRVLNSIAEVTEVVRVDECLSSDDAPRAPTFRHLDDALPHVEAVIIATPPTTHAALALQAVRAGKHVLVEKPFTTSTADAVQLLQVAEDAGVVLMVGHTYAYNGVVQKLRSMVRDGDLGRLYYLDSARLNLGLYRPDVSVVWDLAVHDVAIMNFVLDSTPTRVAAHSGHAASPRFEDICYIWMEYAKPDVTAAIHVSWLDPCKVRRLTIVGSERMAVYNDLSADERLKLYDKHVEFQEADTRRAGNGTEPLSYHYGDVVSPYLEFEEPLLAEDRHFIDCILTGATPLTSGRSGLEVVAVLCAIDKSLRGDAVVAVDEVRELVG